MNVNDLFPSRFLKAHDLGGKAFTLTIRAITLEDVGHGAEKESKLTLAFEEATKMMLLNRTNAMILASMYGPETDAWMGKAVTVYSARVKAFGAWHDALRIKEQIPARNVGAAKMTDAMMEAPPLDDEDDVLDIEEDGSTPRTVDTDTGEITSPPVDPHAGGTGDALFTPEPRESPPHQRMWGQGASAFGPAWDGGARAWLIMNWTEFVAKTDPRDSATELSDTEKDQLADYIAANLKGLQKKWASYKAQQIQSATGEKVAA